MKKYTELQQIKDLYRSHFFMHDDTIIDAIIAICISSKLGGDAVWLMLVGAPSTGKTELVNILTKVNFVHMVSTMTENTFLSSMRSTAGKENSLLHRIGPRGMILMKDYTTVISMRSEKKEQILAQMREVFDGQLKKESGNGVSQEWRGKINWIGCVTDVIYSVGGESAAMGRRSMVFELPPLTDGERLEMGRAANKIRHNIGSIREELQNAVKEFVDYKIENLPEVLPEISKEMEEDLLQISSFVTRVRTGVDRDWRNTLQLVYESEGLTRFNSQLTKTIEIMLYVSGKTEVDDTYRNFAFKIGIDSIPKQRRIALTILAEYAAATAKGVAVKSGMPTETMRMAMEELNALRIVDRKPNPNGVGADHWSIKDKYRGMMVAYGGVSTENFGNILEPDDEETETELSPGMQKMFRATTDDAAYNQELDEAQRRSDAKFVSELEKVSARVALEQKISALEREMSSLDLSGWGREQSIIRSAEIEKELQELTIKLESLVGKKSPATLLP